MNAATVFIFGIRKQLILSLTIVRNASHSKPESLERSDPHLILPRSTRQKHQNFVSFSSSKSDNIPKIVEKASDVYKNSLSSASFRANVKVLHQKKLRYVSKLTCWLKVILVGSFAVLVATLVSFAVFCQAEVSLAAEMFDVVSDFQQMTYWTLKVSIASRDLFLFQSGVFDNETMIRGNLNIAGSALKALSDDVRNNMDLKTGLWTSVLSPENVWWQYGKSDFVLQYKNLVNTLEALATYSFALSTTSLPVSASSQPLITLLRNAHTETTDYMSKKAVDLVQKAKTNVNANWPVIVLLICLCEAVILAQILSLGLIVFLLGKFRKRIWEFIFETPNVVLTLSKSAVLNRLSMEHGEEFRIEAETPIKSKEKQGNYTRTAQEKFLFSVLILALFASVVFLFVSIFSYFSGLSSFSDLIQQNEGINSERVKVNMLALIFMKDAVFPRIWAPLDTTMSSFVHTPDSTYVWTQLMETAGQNECVFYQDVDLSGTIEFSANYHTFSGHGNALQYGLHSAVEELIMAQQELKSDVMGVTMTERIAQVRQIDDMFYQMEPDLILTRDSYNRLLQTQNEVRYYQMIEAVSAFSSGIVLVTIAAILPLLLKVKST